MRGANRFGGLLAAAVMVVVASAASAQTIGFSQVGSESDWRTAFSAEHVEGIRNVDVGLIETGDEARKSG